MSGPPRASAWRRALLLAACIAAGSAVGVVGQWLSGSAAWWLAVPGAMAAVWLFVADPRCCELPQGRAARPLNEPPLSKDADSR